MGKVLEFRATTARKSGHVEAKWDEAAEEAAAVVEKTAEMKAGFGPDDFSFSWLVVGDRQARFGDDVSTFPLAQDGYSL